MTCYADLDDVPAEEAGAYFYNPATGLWCPTPEGGDDEGGGGPVEDWRQSIDGGDP